MSVATLIYISLAMFASAAATLSSTTATTNTTAHHILSTRFLAHRTPDNRASFRRTLLCDGFRTGASRRVSLTLNSHPKYVYFNRVECSRLAFIGLMGSFRMSGMHARTFMKNG